MMWSHDLWAGWQPQPAPHAPRPIRQLVLSALAEAVIGRHEAPAYCQDCRPAQLCPDHVREIADAAEFEAAYARILGIGSDGAMLTLTGGLS